MLRKVASDLTPTADITRQSGHFRKCQNRTQRRSKALTILVSLAQAQPPRVVGHLRHEP